MHFHKNGSVGIPIVLYTVGQKILNGWLCCYGSDVPTVCLQYTGKNISINIISLRMVLKSVLKDVSKLTRGNTYLEEC